MLDQLARVATLFLLAAISALAAAAAQFSAGGAELAFYLFSAAMAGGAVARAITLERERRPVRAVVRRPRASR